jgi:hypothetical protein
MHDAVGGAMDGLTGKVVDPFGGSGFSASANLAVAASAPVVHVHIGNDQIEPYMVAYAGQAIDAADWRAGTRMSR